MKIAIGNDHIALDMKKEIAAHLKNKGYNVINLGTDSADRCDYPIYGEKVARMVVSGEADLGILICGTGIGMSMAANKIKGIRCALVGDTFSARMTKEHNNANVLALGARVLGLGLMLDIVDIFVSTEYSNDPRHQKRVDKVMGLEK